jgi:hypothetical protein
MILPFGDILLFGAFVTAAVLYRRRPEAHKRLMLFAIIGGLLAAPIVHIVGYFSVTNPAPLWLLVGLYLSSAVYDVVSRRRVHPVSWIAPFVIVGFVIARNVLVANTRVWHNVVAWWTDL